MRSLKTEYADCEFESRLEARWAIFFDALGIRWEYEAEGFNLGDGVNYLPDFRLKLGRSSRLWWAEVKPIEFTDEESEKAKRLVQQSALPLLKLIGPPDFKAYSFIEPIPCIIEDIIIGYSELIFPSSQFTRNRVQFEPSPEEIENLSSCQRYSNAVNGARGKRFHHGKAS